LEYQSFFVRQRVPGSFYKILTKGGHLLISIPNDKFEPKLEDGRPRNPFHKQIFNIQEIKQKLRETGFKIEKILSQPYTNVFLKV
jgi:hypothetical protein